ncbi:stage II sporulation protein E [Paenactinomyces guangxiensis]|uniref:Stage II sporulation protein E n=1 Tax=Paenactinomyces guangxiensis TaxID=1490290 RepID=A0A7W1WTX8_9BACL|nr:stage II sporulation protein E [Paenactinomyces guangxiensis]MBA4495806.1 stage II sporulation protein E [Paenactinomyces guangxiensis]MBH8592896.1 stage II sporulation protein E [Paenactinomyces guangxiensis]
MQLGTQKMKNWFIRPLEKWLGWDRSRQKRWMYRFVHMWNLPVLVIGFLLGRATILDTVSPFAIAYLAVAFHLARKQWPVVIISLIAGAASLDMMHMMKVSGSLVILLMIQKLAGWMGKGQLNYTPFVVGISSAGSQLVRLWIDGWTLYKGMVAGVDVLLSFILTFIFLHSLSLFTVKKKRIGIRHEEVVCLVILIGSVMTGMMGWEIWDLSVIHIFSRYLILVLSLVGGAMLGSSMGVVTGMILSLSNTKAMLQISLLAFAGLLAGLFKEGRRVGVALGFMLGSAILTLYDGGTPAMWLSLQESVIALLLFLLTPEQVFKAVSRFVPGTLENQAAHQDYIRRLRDVTAAKVEQFTELFQELAFSFREDTSKQRREDEDQVHHFISEVMNQSCLGCSRYQHCWEQNVVNTYQGITHLMALVETEGTAAPVRVPPSWASYCIRSEKVMETIQEQYSFYEQSMFWKEKMKESRRLVSDQLTGLAEVMSKLSGDIRHETQVLTAQEDQIHEALEELGLSIQRVDIINLEEGKVELEVTMPHRDGLDECKKLVAPLLTEILGEPIAVYRKEVKGRSTGAVITLGSAQRYELKTGAATAAKGGGFVSGDSYCYMNLGTGKYAVALSDGMGNGQRAQEESHAALKLLGRLLQAGMSEERAVDTVNSILSLRSTDEMFATIDLAMVDLNTAEGRFMKIGSTPGFIKRGKDVFTLTASNPPIGILNEIEIEPIEMKLQPGDLIIMVSDGIYDSPRHAFNKDAFMCRLIGEIDTKDPQDFADCLLEKAVRYHGGRIDDDMTVVVSKIERHSPEWSTIRLPGMRRIERSQAIV